MGLCFCLTFKIFIMNIEKLTNKELQEVVKELEKEEIQLIAEKEALQKKYNTLEAKYKDLHDNYSELKKILDNQEKDLNTKSEKILQLEGILKTDKKGKVKRKRKLSREELERKKVVFRKRHR